MAQRQRGSFSSIDYPGLEQSNIQSMRYSQLFNYQLNKRIGEVGWINNVFGEFDCSRGQCGLNGSISKGDLNGSNPFSFTSP